MVSFSVIMNRLLWVPVVVIALALVVVLAQILDDDPPGTFVPHSQSIEIEPDRLVLSYGIVRRRACPAIVYRSVIDPTGKIDHLQSMSYTSEQIRELQNVQENRVSLVLPRPAKMIPGVYRMQATVVYSCNSAQEIWPIRVSFVVPYRLVPE